MVKEVAVITLEVNKEMKGSLELFREEQLEKVRNQLEKGNGDEARAALTASYQMFKGASYEQLMKMYVSFHQTLKAEGERGIRFNNNEKKRFINLLKNQRDYIDDALVEVGGARFRKDAFDAKTHNDIVREGFRNALMYLRHNNIDALEKYLEESAKKDYL